MKQKFVCLIDCVKAGRKDMKSSHTLRLFTSFGAPCHVTKSGFKAVTGEKSSKVS